MATSQGFQKALMVLVAVVLLASMFVFSFAYGGRFQSLARGRGDNNVTLVIPTGPDADHRSGLAMSRVDYGID